ncbi:MAG TPA: EAL domain-containing protein [Acidimicrobiales bacterium]|nr:EAL domain-containing protein [Acidimicrobiales bacterium]
MSQSTQAGIVENDVEGSIAAISAAACDCAPRILVVDDTPSNVRLLERMLATAGFTEVASTGRADAALELFLETKPDLVLLDLHMPGLDGLEVMAQLRHAVPPTEFLPVIVLTADASSSARDGALQAGANDFLTKPFDNVEVVLRVRNQLRTRGFYQRLKVHTDALAIQVDRARARRLSAERERDLISARIRRALAGGVEIFLQPIVDLHSGAIVGMEALSRFAELPEKGPDVWFAEAAAVGMGLALEVFAVRLALRKLESLPLGCYLAVNVSPTTMCAAELTGLLGSVSPGRVVVELTEHTAVSDYDELLAARGQLRGLGVRLAIDDAGSGISSLQHVLRLSPDLIKLDRSLIQDLDRDPARRVLVGALVDLGRSMQAAVVAEGIETEAELAGLQSLGVPYGQGYLLGRPSRIPAQVPAVPVAANDHVVPLFVSEEGGALQL